MRTRPAQLAGVFSIAVLGLAPGARAVTAHLDFDGVPTGVDFRTAPYVESGITTTVDQGHYELYNDATGNDGDQAFNLDEQKPNETGIQLSQVTVTAEGGGTFDVVSLDVVNPADSVGEYTITAIGGTGGSIPAPVVAGPVDFSQYAPAFQGVSALVITQNSPGSFTFDDLTVNVLPEPSATASLLAAGLAVFALSRRRAR
jgi:hypothetical protein